jgi:uroporphyrinogen-III decarboxylase
MEYPAASTLRMRTFDRLKKSITGEKTDAFAAFHFYTFPFFRNVTGVMLDRYFHDPKTTFNVQAEVLERMEWCGDFAPDTGPVAECSALGGEVCFDAQGFISVKPAAINDLDDVLKIKPGDPYGDNYMRVALETLEYMRDHAPEGIGVNPPFIQGPFTIAAQLRGISEFCMDTIQDPDIVEALLDIAIETIINYMKAAEKTLGKKLHHILLCDDLSAFLGVSSYKEWVLPTYEKFFKEFPDTQPWLHNDSKAGHLITNIAESRFVAWQYAPSLTPSEVMVESGGKIALIGGLNPLELQHISAQETYDLCIKTMQSFKENNKFILSAGGSLNQVPLENALAMLHAADDFIL